jgi:hypothetical protein
VDGRSSAIVVVAAAVVACSTFAGGDSSPPPPPPDDAGADAGCGDTTASDANCGACGAACPSGKTCVASTCVPGCRDKILYVSGDSGKDGNDGCAPDRPVRTIGAALAFVATQDLRAHEIHVCRGTYSERALVLDHAASLRGGYNCVSWTRADTFGAAGKFKDPNETIIEDADVSASTTTLDVRGAAVAAGTIVDGFTIDGPQAGASSGAAVTVHEDAAPVLSDLQVVGGATSSSSSVPGSIGIEVANGADPEITRCSVSGGAGKAAAFTGSVGIYVHDAAASISDDSIDAGIGSGRGGAVGIFVDQRSSTIPMTIARNHVSWNGPHSIAQNTNAVYGMLVTSGDVAIVDNTVIGGAAACDAGGCATAGILVTAPAKAIVRTNVVYGGDITLDGPAGAAAEGIVVGGLASPEIVGNVIHGGGAGSIPALGAVVALDLSGGSGAQVIGNTIVLDGGVSGTTRVGVRIINGATAPTIRGNLFVGGLGANEVGIARGSCQGSTVTNLHDNVFLAVSFTGQDVTTTTTLCDTIKNLPSPSDVAATFGVASPNDLVLAPLCTDPSYCIVSPCTSAQTCAALVFKSWDASGGATNVSSPGGFQLAPGVRCQIAQRAYPLPSDATQDVYGAPRTGPTFSVGAAEYDGTCTP